MELFEALLKNFLFYCPGNLTLTVSRDGDRDRTLVSMLGEGGSLASCDSVIVYCTRREECERLATHIRCGEALLLSS